MEYQGRLAVGVAARLPVEEILLADVEHAAGVWLDLGIPFQHVRALLVMRQQYNSANILDQERQRGKLTLDELDERSFNSGMGRIAGVTAADTRERLLQAAAEVFAARGYDGTRVADIAAAAGVSNGALYTARGCSPICSPLIPAGPSRTSCSRSAGGCRAAATPAAT
jgi:hypothetical protein